MIRSLTLAGLLGLVAFGAYAAAGSAQSCQQLREQIQAQTGILPKPDTDLLQKLGARPACRFSAAEVYRAAYGDKPLPRNEGRTE